MVLRPQPKRPDAVRKLQDLLALAPYAALPAALVQHGQAVPLGVMVRGTLEWLLDEPTLEALFREHAPRQYTRALTLATLVRLLIQVSAGTRASVYAAYRADQSLDEPAVAASYQALYAKLGRLGPEVSAAVVRHSAGRCGRLLASAPRARAEPLPGYRLRVLDGNALAGTDRRLTPLRGYLKACLPGKSLVVYEPGTGLVTDVVLCEDAYTQERALLAQVLPRVDAGDLILADRGFCTTKFVFGVHRRDAFVVVRQHRTNLPCEPLGKARRVGKTRTGTVHERRVRVADPETGEALTLRRVEVRLTGQTRDGDEALAVLTDLPDEVPALAIADLYLVRWTIETHLQFLTQSLHCELPGLGKPRAALFGFAMALVASNALAVARGAIRSERGAEEEAEVSGHYLADEIAHDYRAVMKYLEAAQWPGWRGLAAEALAPLLGALAGNVDLKAAPAEPPGGPKKPPSQKVTYDKKHKHYSTDRVLKGLQQ